MKSFKLLFAGLALAALSACGSTDSVSRNVSLEFAVASAPAASFTIDQLNISVPETLTVSEAHLLYPVADIVWRGDLPGDRHEQVLDIFETGMNRGATAFQGKDHVTVDVTVVRFHSLTERARYSYGGVHSIKFAMTVRDTKTGEIFMDGKIVRADLEGYGGAAAVEAERRGLTQKVRITSHLAGVLQRELTELSTTPRTPAEPQLSQAPVADAIDDAA
jgi:hypothetical protein